MPLRDYQVSLEQPNYPHMPALLGMAGEQYQIAFYGPTRARPDGLVVLEDRPYLAQNGGVTIQDVREAMDFFTAGTPIQPYFDYLGFQAKTEPIPGGTRKIFSQPPLPQVIARAHAFPVPGPHRLVTPEPYRGDLFPSPLFFKTLTTKNAVLISTGEEKRHDLTNHFTMWSTVPELGMFLMRKKVELCDGDASAISKLMGKVDTTIVTHTMGTTLIEAFQSEAVAGITNANDAAKYWEPVAKVWKKLFSGDMMHLAMAQREHCRAIGQAATRFMMATTLGDLSAYLM